MSIKSTLLEEEKTSSISTTQTLVDVFNDYFPLISLSPHDCDEIESYYHNNFSSSPSSFNVCQKHPVFGCTLLHTLCSSPEANGCLNCFRFFATLPSSSLPSLSSGSSSSSSSSSSLSPPFPSTRFHDALCVFDDEGNQVIHLAVKNSQFNLVEYLINIHHIPIDSRTSLSSETPFLLSSVSGNLPLLEFLSTHGATLSAVDGFRRSALHLAVLFRREEVVKWLVNRGIGLEMKDEQGKGVEDYINGTGDKVDSIRQLLANAKGKTNTSKSIVSSNTTTAPKT